MGLDMDEICELNLGDYKISKLRKHSASFSCHLPSYLSQDDAKSYLFSQLEYSSFAVPPLQIKKQNASYLKSSSALRSPIQHF